MQPLQKGSAASAPVEAGGDAIVYANSSAETDTVIRPTAFGTTIIEHRRGPTSPSSFSWRVKLRPGEELRKLANGSVVVVSSGINLDGLAVPAYVPPLTPASISDVNSQLIRAGANVAEANNAVDGEIVAVVAPPRALLNSREMTIADVKVSSGEVITATLPSGIVADTIAMIIEANTNPDPVAMCAHAFEGSPGLYDDGCSEPDDPDAEPEASSEENLTPFDLTFSTQPELHGDFSQALSSDSGAVSSTTSSGNPHDNEWCGRSLQRQAYCVYFFEDKVWATRLEAGMFNIPSDSTKANAFKHALWTSAMVGSDPPDGEALSFALNHEKGQWNSKRRLTRYKSAMDVLNNLVAYRFAHYRTNRDDMAACAHFVEKIGSAQFIGFNRNPTGWANQVGFEYHNLVYRRKYEAGELVHLVTHDCNAGLVRGIYLGAG
jgi:hypothetical protein